MYKSSDIREPRYKLTILCPYLGIRLYSSLSREKLNLVKILFNKLFNKLN